MFDFEPSCFRMIFVLLFAPNLKIMRRNKMNMRMDIYSKIKRVKAVFSIHSHI